MADRNTDLNQIYNTYFQKPYYIGNEWNADRDPNLKSDTGKIVNDQTKMGIPIGEIKHIAGHPTGIEVYLPVEFTNITGDYKLKVECATIRITTKNTIIKTELSQRQGSVHEVFSSGDYVFTIKGVLISKYRTFPEEEIIKLKNLAKNESQVLLNNAYAELFMPGENRVVIESLEFPEQEGKHIRFRPFVLVCETDLIDTLSLKDYKIAKPVKGQPTRPIYD